MCNNYHQKISFENQFNLINQRLIIYYKERYFFRMACQVVEFTASENRLKLVLQKYLWYGSKYESEEYDLHSLPVFDVFSGSLDSHLYS